MTPEHWSAKSRQSIAPESPMVQKHLEFLRRMVAIDSRSFGVGEYPGDRREPTDMGEILDLAREYLESVGFGCIRINQPAPAHSRATPLLLADLVAGPGKPTVLMYAHLDKQPYMDDQEFKKWGGAPPTELRWNDDKTRAYGRGAADDLSGVVAIGLAVEAWLKGAGQEGTPPDRQTLDALPCNVKVIYETEEESGSYSLVPQILQNRAFFEDCDCVIITDVLNPDTGIPGLTTSLRGILQMQVEMEKDGDGARTGDGADAQTALYQLLATLIRPDHGLAVEGIAQKDLPVTGAERQGYAEVPISLEMQRQAAGLLPDTRWVVAADKGEVIECQLRRSYVNVRPGHRVAGGVVFGAAGARLTLPLLAGADREVLRQKMLAHLEKNNPFRLQVNLHPEDEETPGRAVLDLLVHASSKDPHSGVVGGPYPVAELQLARMIGSLIDGRGRLRVADVDREVDAGEPVGVQALHVEHDGARRLFASAAAKALIEIRLAPGNDEEEAASFLQDHLMVHLPVGYRLQVDPDKGGDPWMTQIEHPVFPLMLESLKTGFGVEPCLYGCGGSIPFVSKLMQALGSLPPLCVGAYDPECKMHEPGESLSMTDLLGCARSIVHFLTQIAKGVPDPKAARPPG